MSEETITLIAAIIATVIGVGSFFHYFLMANAWPRTTGRVVGNEAGRRSDAGFDQWAYFPLIKFQAADGRTYRIKGDIGLNDEWPLGQAVQLRYRPANPQHATIAKSWQRLLFACVFLGFAAACWLAVLDQHGLVRL